MVCGQVIVNKTDAAAAVLVAGIYTFIKAARAAGCEYTADKHTPFVVVRSFAWSVDAHRAMIRE